LEKPNAEAVENLGKTFKKFLKNTKKEGKKYKF